MRGLAEANRNQLASDVRFLTAPLKFVWGMFMWAIVLLLSPFLLIATLVFGTHFMSADEIGLVKVLLVVLGPFAFVFWWIIVRHVSSRNRAKRLIAERSQSGEEYSEAELRCAPTLNERNRDVSPIDEVVSVLKPILAGLHAPICLDSSRFRRKLP